MTPYRTGVDARPLYRPQRRLVTRRDPIGAMARLYVWWLR